jgi:hypothetical protein
MAQRFFDNIVMRFNPEANRRGSNLEEGVNE